MYLSFFQQTRSQLFEFELLVSIVYPCIPIFRLVIDRRPHLALILSQCSTYPTSTSCSASDAAILPRATRAAASIGVMQPHSGIGSPQFGHTRTTRSRSCWTSQSSISDSSMPYPQRHRYSVSLPPTTTDGRSFITTTDGLRCKIASDDESSVEPHRQRQVTLW